MEQQQKQVEPWVIGCTAHCFQGYKGMDNCNRCGCTGSMFAVMVKEGQIKTWPNTEQGYKDAKEWLKNH